METKLGLSALGADDYLIKPFDNDELKENAVKLWEYAFYLDMLGD